MPSKRGLRTPSGRNPPPFCPLGAHDAIKSDPAAFAALKLVGQQQVPHEPPLELRNCPRCHSTLAIERPKP